MDSYKCSFSKGWTWSGLAGPRQGLPSTGRQKDEGRPTCLETRQGAKVDGTTPKRSLDPSSEMAALPHTEWSLLSKK